MRRNLTDITWGHAINSAEKLREALKSSIDMIEADIVLGKVNECGPDLPIMAHPPLTTSDISLEQFLRQVTDYNARNPQRTKGIKLDFKSIEVFEGSLKILHELVPMITFPLWLNADIVKGPVNETDVVPVDPKRFFNGCALFNRAVLSIGWTTRWGPDFTVGSYTMDQIDDMLNAIKNNNVDAMKGTITFPVRAGIAANSLDQLAALVKSVQETNEASLTIWSAPNDKVDVAKLKHLILFLGLDRVYLDLPEELLHKLDLNSDHSNATV